MHKLLYYLFSWFWRIETSHKRTSTAFNLNPPYVLHNTLAVFCLFVFLHLCTPQGQRHIHPGKYTIMIGELRHTLEVSGSSVRVAKKPPNKKILKF